MTTSIVIPAYNNLDFTRKAVDAVRANTTDYELIIVDNASSDGTAEFLWGVDTHIIRNEENLGFAAACNQGAKEASGDFILLLNNDTEVREGWLEALLGRVTNKTGVIGSKLLYPNETIQHAGVYFIDRGNDFWPYHKYLTWPSRIEEANVAKSLLAVTGACFLVPRKVWERLEGMDEGYVKANFEDIDFCLRAKQQGLEVWYEPKSVVTHYHSQTINLVSDEIAPHFQANFERLMTKHFDYLKGELRGADREIRPDTEGGKGGPRHTGEHAECGGRKAPEGDGPGILGHESGAGSPSGGPGRDGAGPGGAGRTDGDDDTSTGRAENGRPPRIFFLSADYWGCGWYRCQVPAEALQRKGYEVGLEEHFSDARMDYYDTFILQRQSSPFMLEVVDRLREKGKFVVGELDDDFWHLHKDSPVYDYWYGNDFANLRILEQFLGKCHRVTTTTKVLADTLRQFNKDVVVVPNYLPDRTWDIPKRTNERLVVGWAGGEPHGMDMPLLEFMGQVVQDHDVEFQVCGRREYPFAFPYTVVPPRDIEHYPEILAGIDIGLAPIIDTAFNRSKSDLKHVEYGRMSIPAVFSKVGPYQEGVRHGVDGFLAGNPGDWVKFTKRLIEQPRLREQIAKAARRKADKRSIDRNVHRWIHALGLREV